MLSALQHQEIIDAYLKEECDKGRITGPFMTEDTQGVHISRFGVTPKRNQPGKWQLIVDLSHPKGTSVNDLIDSKQTAVFSVVHLSG